MKTGARRGRHRHKVGRTRIKLSERLREVGIDIPPEALWWNDGVYGTRQMDCVKWGGNGAYVDPERNIGRIGFVTVSSWDTMTECATEGVTLTHYEQDETHRYEISAGEYDEP
jgi:hypothetical protein